MRKLFKLFTLLFMLMTIVMACNKPSDKTNAEESYDGYYWYEGKKIPLQKLDNMFYVVFYLADEKKFRYELSKAGIELKYVQERKDYSFTFTDMSGSGAWELTNFITATIESSYKNAATALSYTIYWAPFYKLKDENEVVGITEVVGVHLKPGVTFTQLEQLAQKNSVKIIGKYIYYSNSYMLVCTKQSKGNSLEIANRFYESGLFEYTSAEMMGSITPL